LRWGEAVPSTHEAHKGPPDPGVEPAVVLTGEAPVPADDRDFAAVSDPDSLSGGVDGADDVELVGHDPSVGQDITDGFAERPVHVATTVSISSRQGPGEPGPGPVEPSPGCGPRPAPRPDAAQERTRRCDMRLRDRKGRLVDRQHLGWIPCERVVKTGPSVEGVGHPPPGHPLLSRHIRERPVAGILGEPVTEPGRHPFPAQDLGVPLPAGPTPGPGRL